MEINYFDWQILHGKQLEISVGVAYEGGDKTICVIGRDMDSGILYTLHMKTEYDYKSTRHEFFGDAKNEELDTNERLL